MGFWHRSVSKTLLALLLPSFFLAPVAHAGRYDDLNLSADIIRFGLVGAAVVIPVLKRDRHGLVELGVSTGVTAGIIEGTKWAVNRRRPDGGRHSFPSGHTSFAFSMASFLHYRYGWQYGLPAYVGASFVAYSRVQADRHFVTDVVAGALIANAVAFFLVDSVCEHVIVVPIIDARKHHFGLLAWIPF